MNALEHVLNKHAAIVIARLANDDRYEVPDVDSIDPDDWIHTCRYCQCPIDSEDAICVCERRSVA